MKQIIVIIFCLFAVTSFAQQKNTSSSKPKSSLTTNKSKTVSTKKTAVKKIEFLTCSKCEGTGKCSNCDGEGKLLCWSHDGFDYCDDDGFLVVTDDNEPCASGCTLCGQYEKIYLKCKRCYGAKKCEICAGSGKVKKN